MGELDCSHNYLISYYNGDTLIRSQKYYSLGKGAYLQNIYVNQEYRGYGIGKFLLKAALAHLESKGVKNVSLERGTGSYYSSRRALHKLYTSLGFKQKNLFSNEYSLRINETEQEEE